MKTCFIVTFALALAAPLWAQSSNTTSGSTQQASFIPTTPPITGTATSFVTTSGPSANGTSVPTSTPRTNTSTSSIPTSGPAANGTTGAPMTTQQSSFIPTTPPMTGTATSFVTTSGPMVSGTSTAPRSNTSTSSIPTSGPAANGTTGAPMTTQQSSFIPTTPPMTGTATSFVTTSGPIVNGTSTAPRSNTSTSAIPTSGPAANGTTGAPMSTQQSTFVPTTPRSNTSTSFNPTSGPAANGTTGAQMTTPRPSGNTTGTNFNSTNGVPMSTAQTFGSTSMPQGNCPLYNDDSIITRTCFLPNLYDIGDMRELLTDPTKKAKICAATKSALDCASTLTRPCPADIVASRLGNATFFYQAYDSCCGNGSMAYCPLNYMNATTCPMGGLKVITDKCGPNDITTLFCKPLSENDLTLNCYLAKKLRECIQAESERCANKMGIIALEYVDNITAQCCASSGPSPLCPARQQCILDVNPAAAAMQCPGFNASAFDRIDTPSLRTVCDAAAIFLTCAKNATTGCSKDTAKQFLGAAEDKYLACCLKTGITTACPLQMKTCDDHPCMNNATCANGVSGFTCTCKRGFSGPRCEMNVNECASNPCPGAVCEDLTNGFRCICNKTGFTGANCATAYFTCANAGNFADEQNCDMYFTCAAKGATPTLQRCNALAGMMRVFEKTTSTCLAKSTVDTSPASRPLTRVQRCPPIDFQ